MSARPANPMVLISPAMAIGSGFYRPLVEAFEARGWSAQALPRRGFERDTAPAGRGVDWSYADEIADTAAAVAKARAEDAGRPVLLLGHSLGGQLAVGHEATCAPVDGVVTVGAGIPHTRHFRWGGLELHLMGRVIVPLASRVFGHVPKPAFGGPGARTLMREWARMVLSGQPPFRIRQPIGTPLLAIALEGDDLAPVGAIDDLAELFEPSQVTRWQYDVALVPEGGSNDHIRWVRTPAPVVDRVLDWWAAQAT